MLQKFFVDNAVTIVVLIVGFVIGWSTLQADVKVVKAENEVNEQKIETLSRLVERVIVLEERDKNYDQDFLEIKQDLRDIKQHLNVQ